MYKLSITKLEEEKQRIIFNDIVENLEITTYGSSIELEFDLEAINFRIEFYKKDNVKMSIELV